MLKSLLFTAMAALVLASVGMAQQSKVVIPVKPTPANDGKQMYTNYCAPCHGTDGRGAGPAASAMKDVPTDLTMLAKNNHGKYPDAHVYEVLQFGSDIPAHGSAQMPVWGKILANMNRTNGQEKELRLSNLTEYLRSMQAR